MSGGTESETNPEDCCIEIDPPLGVISPVTNLKYELTCIGIRDNQILYMEVNDGNRRQITVPPSYTFLMRAAKKYLWMRRIRDRGK